LGFGRQASGALGIATLVARRQSDGGWLVVIDSPSFFRSTDRGPSLPVSERS
jgi:ketosteroid isomerase-like protein